MNWLFLLVAIVGEVVGTSALKASEGFTRLGPSAVVLVGYGVCFYCLSIALKTIPMGVAYGVWSGVGIVLISLIGLFLFRQRLDLPALIGLAMIMAGVVVIHLFSKSAA